MGWLPDIPNPLSALGNAVKKAVPKAVKTVVGKDAYDILNPWQTSKKTAQQNLAEAKKRAAAAAAILAKAPVGTVKPNAVTLGPKATNKGYLPVDPFKGIGALTGAEYKKLAGINQSVVPPDTGLGALFGSTAIAAGNAAAAAAKISSIPKVSGSKTVKSKTGSSGPVGPAVPAGPSQEDLLNQMYDDLIKRIQGEGEASTAQFGAGKAAVEKNYASAAEDLYSRYLRAHDDMVGRSENLQAPMNDDITQASLRRLQETSDLSKATDESWFDKMAPLQSDLFAQMGVGVDRDRLARQQELALAKLAAATGKGGGGGGGSRKKGGGGGGGGGSSKSGMTAVTGSITDTAKDLFEFMDPTEYNHIQELKKYDPVLGASRELDWAANNLGDEAASYVSNIRAPKINPVKPINKLKPTSSKKDVARTAINALNYASKSGQSVAVEKARALGTKQLADLINFKLNTPSKKTTVTSTGTQKKTQPKSWIP